MREARCGSKGHEVLTREPASVLIGSPWLLRAGSGCRLRLMTRHVLEPPPKIRGCRQDGERARDPDAHGHERLKPEAEAKLRQDETGKQKLGEGIGLAHEERIDGDGARQYPR